MSKGYKVINPFKKERKLNEKYKVREYYDSPTLQHALDIRKNDFELVKACDEFFAWFPLNITCIGTTLELAKAIKHKKRIIVLTPRLHPFLYGNEVIDELYLTVEDFLKNKPFWKNINGHGTWVCCGRFKWG